MSADKLSLLLDRAPVTLMVISSEGVLESFHGGAFKVAVHDSRNNLGKNLLCLYEDRPDICKPIREALEGRPSFSRLNFKGVEFETYFEPVLNSSGQVDHVVAFSIAFTDQKRMQNELSYQELANSMPQIVWTARPDGFIDYYNNKWHEFTGLPMGQKGDEGWDTVVHPEDLSKYRAIWRAAVNSCESCELELRIKKNHGDYTWFLGRANPTKDVSGKILKWYGTFTNIHDRKIAMGEFRILVDREQAALLRGQVALAQLKKALKENADIKEDRLRLQMSERAALEASQLKSQFLANMSHEIRTPLNGVVGMANLIQKTKLTKAQKEYIDLVVQSAEHLNSIVNDILDLSKVESNRLQLSISEIDLRELVTNVYGTLKHIANRKKIRIRMKSDIKKGFKFYGDAIRLRQILLNLVQNAIKFTERGFVEIRFSYTVRQGRYVIRFEIQDTGVGINQKAQGLIFDPFTQADSSITRKFGGTGLGLSICKKLIQLMDGEIGVESIPSKGSTFFFELPAKRIDKRTVLKRKEKKKDTEMSIKPLRILVAEDHHINQKVIGRVLETGGHSVEIVSDGLEVLNTLKRKSYDLVLMDCHMPNMDGFTTSTKVRRLKGAVSKIPIVALTADALKETYSKCIKAGMNGYVSKPIDSKVLFSEMNRVLKSDRPARIIQNKLRKMSSFADIIDLNAIEKLRDLNEPGSKDFAVELIDDFLTKSPSIIAMIDESLESGDLNGVFKNAHMLKSIAAAIGARQIESASEKLEESSRYERLAESKKCFSRLKKTYEETVPYLSEFQKKIS